MSGSAAVVDAAPTTRTAPAAMAVPAVHAAPLVETPSALHSLPPDLVAEVERIGARLHESMIATSGGALPVGAFADQVMPALGNLAVAAFEYGTAMVAYTGEHAHALVVAGAQAATAGAKQNITNQAAQTIALGVRASEALANVAIPAASALFKLTAAHDVVDLPVDEETRSRVLQATLNNFDRLQSNVTEAAMTVVNLMAKHATHAVEKTSTKYGEDVDQVARKAFMYGMATAAIGGLAAYGLYRVGKSLRSFASGSTTRAAGVAAPARVGDIDD